MRFEILTAHETQNSDIMDYDTNSTQSSWLWWENKLCRCTTQYFSGWREEILLPFNLLHII